MLDKINNEISAPKGTIMSNDTLEGLLKREHAPLHAAIQTLTVSQKETNSAVQQMATALAKGEEKFEFIAKHQEQQDLRLNAHDDKLGDVDGFVAVNTSRFELFRWVAGGAIMATISIFWYFDEKFNEILENHSKLLTQQEEHIKRAADSIEQIADEIKRYNES